ncbi:MAG: hypothetical protein HP496_17860, partial [Nitrospira sp.]|nr:hypothetical protein [Nitrospira sp.]
VRLTQHDSSTCFFTVLYPYKVDEPNISVEMPVPDRGPQARLLGERASVQITVAHNRQWYRDELVFTDQTDRGAGMSGTSFPSHACVSRIDRDGRLLFQHQA